MKQKFKSFQELQEALNPNATKETKTIKEPSKRVGIVGSKSTVVSNIVGQLVSLTKLDKKK